MTKNVFEEFGIVAGKTEDAIKKHPAYQFYNYLHDFAREMEAEVLQWFEKNCPAALSVEGADKITPVIAVEPYLAGATASSKVPASSVVSQVFRNIESDGFINYEIGLSILDTNRYFRCTYNSKDKSLSVRTSLDRSGYVDRCSNATSVKLYETSDPDGLKALDKDLKQAVSSVLVERADQIQRDQQRKNAKFFNKNKL